MLGHVEQPVDPARVEDARQELLRPAADAGDVRTVARSGTDDLDAAVLFLQVAGNTHDRAGRTHGRNEMRDAAVGVPPDLRSGATVVRAAVVRVAELVKLAPAVSGSEFISVDAYILHRLALGSQDDLSAVSPAGEVPFAGRAVRHHQGDADAEQRPRSEERRVGKERRARRRT